MTLLYADGFEAGSTLAEANLMSGFPLVPNANVNATSTYTFGASTTGKGRSLALATFPNSTNANNQVGVVTQINGFLGASGPVGYKFSFGFRGRLNQSKAAVTSEFGLKNQTATASGIEMLISASLATLPQNIMIYLGTINVANFNTVTDYSFHYYTFTATKTAINVWSLTVLVDNTIMFSGTNLSAALVDAIFLFYVWSSGTTLTSQVNIFAEIDDVYITDTDPLGQIYIRRISPTSDVQAQWNKVGNQPTNYQSIDNVSLSTGNSVTSDVPATDIYGNGSQITNGKKILAIRGSAICNGSPSDTVTETVTVGSTAITSAPTALSGADMLVTTGWNTTTLPTTLGNVRFGMTKN